MGISSKIAWTLGGVLLLGSVFAGQKEAELSSPTPPFGRPNLSEVSRRLEAVERKLDQVSETKVTDALGGRNPPAFGSSGYTGLYSNVSFLYWKAFNRGWLVASERRYPVFTPSGNSYNRWVPCELDFDWSPGIRVGFGYNSKYDSWNVQGIYTWIRFSSSRHFVSRDFGALVGPINLGIYPEQEFVAPATIGGVFRTADGYWRLNQNVADLQFARGFYITKALMLQPLLGVRFAALFQSIRAHFGDNLLGTPGAPEFARYSKENSYWGIGPRIGIDGKWTLPENFGFTGLITGAVLYGKFDMKQHTLATLPASPGPLEEVSSARNSIWTVIPTLQLALGADWGMSFNRDRMYWGLNLSWEFNYWWNQAHFDFSRLIQFPIEMQGITFRTELRF